MRVSVRRGVFETASSSLHSLVIDSNCEPAPDENEFIAGYNCFGRWRDTCRTPESRLTYLWQLISTVVKDEEERASWERLIRTWMPAAVLPRYDADGCDCGVSSPGAMLSALQFFEQELEMLGCFLLGDESAVECGSDEEEWGYERPSGPYWEYTG